MKIRTQFIIITALFLVLLTGVSASLIITDAEFGRTNVQEQVAANIERDARELDYMSNDYLLYREAQGRARWQTSFDALSAEVDALNPRTPEQQAISADMQTNRDRLGTVFADVAATVERGGQTLGSQGDADFIRVSWSRLEVQNQGLVFDATRLRQLVTAQANDLQSRNRILVFVLMSLITAYLIFNYFTIFRRALGGVARLEAGTKVVGAGNLDHQIPVQLNDEIADLTRSFNQMTASLRTVTASKAELEREMAEREKVETALSQSEQRFRTMFDKSLAIMLLSDPLDFRILQVNEAAVSFYGYAGHTLLNMKLTDLNMLPDAVVRARVNDVLAGKGGIINTNHRLRTGEVRPVQVLSSPIQIGEQRLVFTIIQDITERRRAEEELARSNQQISDILASIQEDFYVVDRDWNFVYANRQFTAKVSKEPQDLIGKNLWQMFPKYLGTVYEIHLRAAMDKLETRRFEMAGKYTNAYYAMAAFPSADGITVLGSDITEQRKVEAALQESEEKYRLTVNSVKDYAIFLLDSNGRVASWNDGAQRLHGYAAEEIIGRHFSLFFTGADVAAGKPEQELELVLARGWFEEEGLRVRKDGSTFWSEVFITPLRYASGGLIGFTKAVRDVSERKRLKEQAAALERLATIGQLSGSIAHEIRNPLAIVDSSAYMIRRLMPNADEKVKTHLERMNGGVRRCLDIIEALLNLTRLGETKTFPVDLKEFTLRMLEENKPPAGVAVVQDFSTDSVTIKGDQDQLQMVFRNLITNAVQAMNGKGTLRVTINRDGVMGRLVIADTGPGISRENLDKIFQPLFSTKTIGIGLGLSITQKIVEKHHGKITVEPEEGWGAVFVVRLPLNESTNQ